MVPAAAAAGPSSSCSSDPAGTCYPGCECPHGTFLSTTHDDDDDHYDHAAWYQEQQPPALVCVALEDCPCRYQGRSYPPASVVDVNCNSWYRRTTPTSNVMQWRRRGGGEGRKLPPPTGGKVK